MQFFLVDVFCPECDGPTYVEVVVDGHSPYAKDVQVVVCASGCEWHVPFVPEYID